MARLLLDAGVYSHDRPANQSNWLGIVVGRSGNYAQ
jgi:hypothetical protein